VHRGQPDKRAIKSVLEAFKEGRLVAIAPEGRESLTGSLEEGTTGAAYLAIKGKVPLIPVTFTGTENQSVFYNIKHFRQTDVTVTIGRPFYLDAMSNWRESVHEGTEKIMRTLARQLPPAYQGYYREAVEQINERS
jgi:1-acyl-sn-glycerol-3-phosphate acyltransferase